MSTKQGDVEGWDRLFRYLSELPEEQRNEFLTCVWLRVAGDELGKENRGKAMVTEANKLKAEGSQPANRGAESLKKKGEELEELARQTRPDPLVLSETLRQLAPDALLPVFASGRRRWMDWYVRYQERREPTAQVKDAQQVFKHLADQYANLELRMSSFANLSPAEQR